MNGQQLQMKSRPIAIQLTNGQHLEGEIFLQLYSAIAPGGQRLDEILNGDELFFPLKTDTGVELINCEQIVSLTTAASAQDNNPLLGTCKTVQLETSRGETLELTAVINLPGENQRSKDFLNQNRRFLLFYQQEQEIYLARREIVRVCDKQNCQISS